MKQAESHCETAREILGTIPLIMRIVAHRLQQAEPELMLAHFRTLMMLSQQTLSLSQLALIQQLSLPTISNTVTALEERGWVSRTRSQADRRVMLAALTTQGKDALQSAGYDAETYICGLLENVSAEDEATVRQGLAILHQVFTEVVQSTSESNSEQQRPG